MRRILLATVTTLIAIGAAATASAVVAPGPQAQAADQAEAQRLARFKFESLDKVAASQRNIRRVSYADIFNDETLPGVILEKTATGEVDITIISAYGKTIDTAVLKPEAWDYVTKRDAKGLAQPKVIKAATEICDGATVVIESTSAGKVARRDAGVCGGKVDEDAMEYARLIAEVAVTSIPRCSGFVESGREYSWILRECLNRTARRLAPTPYATATGDNHDNFRSFAITAKNVARAAPSQDERY